MFTCNYLITFFNYFKINKSLTDINRFFTRKGANIPVITTYLNVLIQYFTAFLFAFIVALCYKKPTPKAIKVYGTINFYSDEFEEVQNEVSEKQAEEVESVESKGIKESSEEAKDLIQKVMQLEELRKTGQINDVEYTKLRQKAIKRYKR